MANPQAEPSMDDILASIRRIIAEEDEPAPKARSVRKAPEPVSREPVSRKAPEPVQVSEPEEAEDDIEDEAVAAAPGFEEDDDSDFDIAEDDGIEAAAAESAEADDEPDYGSDDDLDFDVFDHDLTADAATADVTVEEQDVEDAVAQSPADSIGSLTERVEQTMLSKASAGAAASAFKHLEQNVRVANSNSATLEDIIEKMLEPMLQQWLDDNLPRIVEEKVEEEVRRLARRH
ncbi:DUF2497 domain-containing protein [Aquisalinus flavus]|nr:DUF2497 domain-containing protein [Aquisalinus flavus]